MQIGRTQAFTKFVDKELVPAVDELENLSDKNRKHVQKLVYTNMVDRFDQLVDGLILDNCREEHLLSKAFSGNDQPVTESDLYSLLLQSDDLQTALTQRVQDKLRLSVMRQRHSRKLSTVFTVHGDVGNFEKKPRVNPSKGEIVDLFKVHLKTTPHSICGYADWLYARRNAIVHGSGTAKFLENDKKQIRKLYNVSVADSFKISVSSIRTASVFYVAVCELLREGG